MLLYLDLGVGPSVRPLVAHRLILRSIRGTQLPQVANPGRGETESCAGAAFAPAGLLREYLTFRGGHSLFLTR